MGRGYRDQIAILRIIVEQPVEWQSLVYICFVDFAKPLTVSTGTSYLSFSDKECSEDHQPCQKILPRSQSKDHTQRTHD